MEAVQLQLRRIAAFLLIALVAACETAYKDGVPNERSSAFEVPVDSKLVLHRSIEIPPGQGSAYLQQGKLLRWYHVNQYAPYCALGLGARREVVQSVSPDEFVIRKVTQRFLFTLAAVPPEQAGHALRQARLVHAADRADDGMTYEVVGTVMDVHSAGQPEVRALTCANWGLPQGRSYLTVENIRQALGSYFTLELAAQARPKPAT
jgi:hypothetical protein